MSAANVLNFPRIFCHYSRILHIPSTYVVVAHCLSVLFVAQQIAIGLLPILVRARQEERPASWVYKGICIMLYFRSDYPWLYTNDAYDSEMLAFLAIFMIPVGICYAQYLWGFETPTFLKQTRCLTVFLQPNVVIMALTVHSSRYVNQLLLDGFSIEVALMLAIDSTVTAVALALNSTFWPLIQQNPILGDAQIPSRLIPDSGNDPFLQLELILVGVALFMPNRTTSFFVTMTMMIIGIARWHGGWELPYMSRYYTVANGALSMSFVCMQILFWISQYWKWLTDERLMVVVAIVVLVSLGLSMMKYMRLEASILERLMNPAKIEFESSREALRVAQFAVLNNIITDELIDGMKDVSDREKNFHVTMAKIYCEILKSDGNYSNELQESAKNLFTIQSIPLMERFIAYQLYQTVIHDRVICDDQPAVQAIQERVNAYLKRADEFWSCTIKGEIRQALVIMKELSFALTELTCDFDNLFNFYPNDPQILMLEFQFFRHFRPMSGDSPYSLAANWIRAGPMLREKHLAFIGAPYFNKVLKDPVDESESMSRTSSGDSETRIGKITDHLQMYFVQHLSPLNIVLLTLTVFGMLFLCAMCAVLTNTYTEKVATLASSHSIMSYVWYMTGVSSRVWTLVAHLVSATPMMDTKYLSWSEEAGAYNMEQFGKSVYRGHHAIAELGRDLIWLSALDEFKDFWSFWTTERISVALLDDGQVDTGKCYMDMRTHILYFSSLIAELIRTSPTKNITSRHRFIQSVDMNPESWFKTADVIPQNTYRSVQLFDKFTDRMCRGFSDSLHTGFLSLGAVSLITILLSVVTGFSIERDIHKTIMMHFRPEKHPNPDIDSTRSSTIKECPLLHIGRRYVLLCMFLVCSLFIGITVASFQLKKFTISVTEDMGILSNLAKLLISSSNLYDSVLRNRQFPSQTRLRNALRACGQLTADQNSLVKSVIKYPTILPMPFYREATLVNTSSANDIFDEFSILEISTAFMIMAKDLLMAPKDLFLERYEQLTVIYQDKLLPEARATARNFINELDANVANMTSFTQIELFMVMVASLVSLCLMIWDMISLVIFVRQFARFMNIIPPKTIAENDCMMSFFRNGEKRASTNNNDFNIMTDIYNKSQSALVMVSMNHAIVAFSSEAKAMFAYRSEQLIGQSIELLIPKEAALSGQNGTKFYQQLEIVSNDQTDLSFEKDLIGMASDGSFLQLHVSVSLVEFQERRFFLLQLKSLSDILFYDEIISWYGDLYVRLTLGSYAFQLFPDYLSTTSPMQQTFKHCALVGIYRDGTLDMSDEISKHVAESRLVEYLSGTTNCCILANSSNHMIVLFVDRDNSTSYLDNALSFYQQYCSPEMPFRGFIVTENETTLVLFPPPPIPDGYKGYEIPLTVANSLVPSTTFEVVGPVIETIPWLLKQLRTYKYVVNAEILSRLPTGEGQEVQDIGSEQYSAIYAVTLVTSPPEF